MSNIIPDLSCASCKACPVCGTEECFIDQQLGMSCKTKEAAAIAVAEMHRRDAEASAPIETPVLVMA